MRSRAALPCAFLLFPIATACARGQTPSPSDSSAVATGEPPGPVLLFRAGTGGLSGADRLAVYTGLGIDVAPDGSGLVDTVCGQPVSAWVDFPDLDDDGTPEVRVIYGNACLSGQAGTSVMLFIRGEEGYRGHLGFPAATAEPLETRNLGFPDLLIGGPGFCFPVYGWDGTEYVHLRDEPQEPGGCDGGPAP